MPATRHDSPGVRALLVVTAGIAGVAVLATLTTPVAADGHTKAEADDYTEEANFTVNFPYTTDHYPGDQNQENGSIEYFATGAEAVRAETDEEGVYMDFVIIDADWIDYSACDIPNTAVFGIDRGSNLSGTQIDEDLVQKQKNTNFRDDGITIDFYDWSDFAGDPPYATPRSQIVAAQGAGSQDGTCLTVTSEPGWYQVQGFINGTAADNGRGTEPSEDANKAGINAKSNYLYVCECDSRAEAEEQLGPAPGSGGTDPTPTPEPTETTESTPTPTAAPDDTPTPTEPPEETPPPTDANDMPTPTEPPEETTASTATDANGGGGGGGNANTGMTPTAGDGTGFGSLAALLSLLASALYLQRRQ
ncbi:PGF-CTERM sorting domain-containing protein [Natronomonas gomsonensis]|uniref:PGF-CTERM sorting domain-containing protein n=1 Tax=Natronomonas gomsonensis TaxID=1046043 RepID=UPI0015C07339|nr:PGF-CTERM sorting domain-containing protein [Natronomonas gomsonensis]